MAYKYDPILRMNVPVVTNDANNEANKLRGRLLEINKAIERGEDPERFSKEKERIFNKLDAMHEKYYAEDGKASIMVTDGYKIKATGKADTLEEAKKFLSKQGKNIEYSRARKSGSKYYFDNAIGDDVGEWDSSSKVVKAYDERTVDNAIRSCDSPDISNSDISKLIDRISNNLKKVESNIKYINGQEDKIENNSRLSDEEKNEQLRSLNNEILTCYDYIDYCINILKIFKGKIKKY